MLKLIAWLGGITLALAIADLIHGPHNGDVHRMYIHVPELIAFLGFLGLLEVFALRIALSRVDLNPWLTLFVFAVVSGVFSFGLFAFSGGSFHGDGGPLSTDLLILNAVSELCIPTALIGFIFSAIIRKEAGSAIFTR